MYKYTFNLAFFCVFFNKGFQMTSEIMKAQTDWLPRWKASLWKGSRMQQRRQDLTFTARCPRGRLPLYRFISELIMWNLDPSCTNHVSGTFSWPPMSEVCRLFIYFLSTWPTRSYRGSASNSNSDRVAPRLCSVPKHTLLLVQITF